MSLPPSRTQLYLHDVAFSFLRRDRYFTAFLVLCTAHAHFLSHHPGGHDTEYSNAVHGLGLKALIYGRPTAAERCFRATLFEKKRTRDPTILYSIIHLARALELQIEYEKAEKVLRRGIKKYTASHEKRLEAVWMLAHVVEKQGRGDDALTLYCYAYVSAKMALGEEHQDAVAYREDYERLKMEMGVEG
jgi:tetratricopeptide (TPR) repeat protein